MIKTALISVSDKEGIAEFAKQLSKLGIKIISTGNTAKLLKQNKIKVTLVSAITRFPEMLDGRLKSVHPNIFAGILADKKNKKHMQELEKLSDGSSVKITIARWLTPQGRTIEKNGITPDVVVEMTDEDYEALKDPQLDKAMETLKTKQ